MKNKSMKDKKVKQTQQQEHDSVQKYIDEITNGKKYNKSQSLSGMR